MSTVENQGTEGLWRRTPSLLPEESDRPEALSVQANMDNDSNSIGTSPLLNRSASSGENINIEYVESCAHIAAGFLFMLAGTSIVPLFAAAASDSLRTENIPYQKTAAGDIILDLSLSHPVKDPATIPCKFIHFDF